MRLARIEQNRAKCGSYRLFTLATDMLEEDPSPVGDVDTVIPQACDLRPSDLPDGAPQRRREPGCDEKEPGLTRKVDPPSRIHTSHIGHVAHDPVNVTDAAKQQLIAARGLDLDDSELVGAVQGEQVDFAAWTARDTG